MHQRLKYAPAPVAAGQFDGPASVSAAQTASGDDITWQVPVTLDFTSWTTDSNGNHISDLTGWETGNSFAVGQGLHGDKTISVTSSLIQTDGSTSLLLIANNYYLDTNGSGSELSYGGAPVTVGEFGNIAPIGAVQTASGYDLAWQVPGSESFTFWTTDSNGNYTSNLTGWETGNSFAVESLETLFGQDLNGDGTIGVTASLIRTDGSTSLLHIANNYYLYEGGSGPELSYGGTPVTAGEFGNITPVGAVKTATGYDIAWQVPGSESFTFWTTDSNGNYTSNLTGWETGNSFAVESLETLFGQDLNGDGTIGITASLIRTDGSTSLLHIANNYYLYAGGSGPELSYGGAPVTAGEFGNIAPVGAVKTATGYDIAWQVPGTEDFTFWTTDANGNYSSNLTGWETGNSSAVESLETIFGQDLNGDGTIGVPPASTFSLQYKGFDYVAFYNGAYENADSLPSLAQTGANSIETTLDYGIDVATSQVVADPNYTDSLAALGATIAQAESLGLSVMVRPLIDFLNPTEIAPYSVGDWRQDYQPNNVAAFFASYKQMIVQEAEVAQANGAQMLSIGAELDQLTGSQYLSYWTDIINSVRQVFTGALTYSASWNTASEVSFWSQLNYEGVDNYVPLSNAPNPTLQDLVNGWLDPATQSSNPGAYAVIGNESPIQYFENLAAQSGKPLLFTELGYANDSGAAADPSASGNSPDPTLQAELYQAFFQAWTQSGSSALTGVYFWEWDPNNSTSNVGPNIDSFSPQNSPALAQAIAGFESVSVPAASQLVVTHAIGAQGSATIGTGATLELTAADSGSVKFDGPTGILILDHSSTFTGELFNLTGNGNPSSSDQIDLRDIDFGPGTAESFSGNATGGTLTVHDAQGHTANILLSGNYTNSTFTLSSDRQGGTIVIDPPVVQDQFVFKTPNPTSPVTPRQSPWIAESTSDAFVVHQGTGRQALFQPTHDGHDAHSGNHDNNPLISMHMASSHDYHFILT